jgi:cytochrome P450
VRITPFELHVEDPDYWDELYSRTNRYDKYEWMSGWFGNSSSVFTTAKHDVHAIRRGALNPMFSKRSVLEFQPEIRKKVEILCRNIAKYKDTGREVSLGDAFSAFAGDVIAEYMLGMSYNHLGRFQMLNTRSPFRTRVN